MKKIEHTIISKLLTKDYCSPKIATLAGKLLKPNTTIHYNVKKMEEDGKIIGYKAVFNFKEIERGFCVIAHMKLDGKAYNDMETFVKFAKRIANNEEVESVDIVTGEWELIVKIRAKDQDEYLTLPAYVADDEYTTMITCQCLNLWERIKVLFTGKIWVIEMTFGKPITPRHMNVNKWDILNKDYFKSQKIDG